MSKYLNYILIACSLSIMACSSAKFGKEVKGPFTGHSYQSNKRYVRATAYGESRDMPTSKQKAMLMAKQEMASSVQSTVKSVTDRYANERMAGSGSETSEKFETLTREVVNQVLTDFVLIDEKTFQKKDNQYITYVALEINKKTLYKRLQSISKSNQKLSASQLADFETYLDNLIKEADEKEDK